MVWYKAAWLNSMFAAFDTIAPNRSKASDGTIGDTAHQAETSGHNPDDTPGVKAERQDADSKPEVRAGDVTSNLRQPGLTMYNIVQRILATPRDRDRLIYIICDGWIWSASNGWRREKYTGTDQHFEHAHCSGNPASDDDGAPWQSILSMGDEMEQSDKLSPPRGDTTVGNSLNISVESRDALVHDDASTGYGAPKPTSMAGRIRDIQTQITALTARPPIDLPALAAALAPLLDETLDASAVLGVLQSDAGQAALTGAANRAEDS